MLPFLIKKRQFPFSEIWRCVYPFDFKHTLRFAVISLQSSHIYEFDLLSLGIEIN